jgi:hypothetical protein
LNTYRAQKKDENKEVWVQLKTTSEYKQGLRERYKVERKFGEGKQGQDWDAAITLGTQNLLFRLC